MNPTHDNILSRIEREYVSFLYDTARRTSPKVVTVSEIQEFIKTPDGKKGFASFKAMRAKKAAPMESQPQKIGAFL